MLAMSESGLLGSFDVVTPILGVYLHDNEFEVLVMGFIICFKVALSNR